jgi:glycosyltransferase involved in cell wall biosynthesis
MASGCAVVSTNVGGLPELVINRYTGLLCSVNALELSKAVIELQNDESLRKEITTTALNFVKRHELNYWREKWIDVLVNQKWISSIPINFSAKE